MRKSTIIWLIIAASLVISGALIFTLALCQTNWDFTSLSTTEFTTTTHEINDQFKDISIDTTTSNVTILPSSDGKCKVECHDQAEARHTVEIESGELKITFVDSRKWYDRIEVMNLDFSHITIYLPDSFSGEISVEATTGDVSVKNLSPKDLEIDLTTGDILVENVSCKGNIEIDLSTGETMLKGVKCASLLSEGGTGDMTLENVIAQGKFEIERTTGDVKFTRCDADEIRFETNTGDVIGSFLTDKNIIPQTSTGEIIVPSSKTGEKCQITTNTGDIRISISK